MLLGAPNSDSNSNSDSADGSSAHGDGDDKVADGVGMAVGAVGNGDRASLAAWFQEGGEETDSA